MSDEPVEASVSEALMALHIMMPMILSILARQDPQQRQELQETLAYAIACCAGKHLPAATPGVVKILTTWRESLASEDPPRLDS